MSARSSIIGTPAPRKFKAPKCDHCGEAGVRFDGLWLCPRCQRVGKPGHERALGDVFTSRRMRRGRGA